MDRIISFIQNIYLSNEVDVHTAYNNKEIYDIKALERLINKEYDKKFECKVFNIDDRATTMQEFRKLINDIKKVIDTVRVSRNYAYMTLLSDTNYFFLYYSTSFNYFDRFNELVEHYTNFINSLNDMLWDEIKYIEYKVCEADISAIKMKIYLFYSNLKIPVKYLDVVVYDNEIHIYAPLQLIGRLIGKKGANVTKLEEMIGKKVKIVESRNLTEDYDNKHPEIPKDSEIVSKIIDVIKAINELEKKGITINKILKYKEIMEVDDNE